VPLKLLDLLVRKITVSAGPGGDGVGTGACSDCGSGAARKARLIRLSAESEANEDSTEAEAVAGEVEPFAFQLRLQHAELRKSLKLALKERVFNFRAMERDHERKRQEEWAQHEIEEFIRYAQPIPKA